MALHNFSAPYGPGPGLSGFGGYFPSPSPHLYQAPAPPPPPPRTFQPPPVPGPVGSTQRPYQHHQQPQHHVSGPTTPRYTRVNSGSGSKTSVHAIIDYDDDFSDEAYYDDIADPRHHGPTVTPIQGPILIKNGSVPVVPLYSYPRENNGSLLQIPILWTALSLALGLEVRGDVIRGVPCIKKYHQLYCPSAGSSYPIDRIETFIDENKALMKRMYGQFEMTTEYGPPVKEYGPPGKQYGAPGGEIYESQRRERLKRRTDRHSQNFSDAPNPSSDSEDSSYGKYRRPRQPPPVNNSETGRIDSCESRLELLTPYWATNSAGKIRAIVNTEHFEQAIHQEICSKKQTNRCSADCGCEQKYKWHRLLAYDPDNDCKGIFMDWFLFPSCCVCRCDPR